MQLTQGRPRPNEHGGVLGVERSGDLPKSTAIEDCDGDYYG